MAELVRVNTNISKDINDWLAERSAKTGISKSTLIHLALEQYRNQIEVATEMPRISAFMDAISQIDIEKLKAVR